VRLERLEVSGFGGLQRRRFDFAERVTVVLGPNESGKSTLHRAIRAALYGLEAGSPGHPRDRSEWARWSPWTGGRYGLALTYRLDSGRRFRVAQSFDRGKIEAQVHELGGADVTQSFRFGRLVSPGQVHLGVDEAVFCAAGWVGEESLRLSSPDGPSIQAGRLREALERLADSGPEGSTAAQALERLRDGLRRVGSERRGGTPLGVATAQARRLEAEIASARRRLEAFAADEERLRALETAATSAASAALEAQRLWLAGRIAQLDQQVREAAEAGEEIAALTAALDREAAHAGFPADEEAAVITLGGELHQAEGIAADAERRWADAQGMLAAVRRRRAEVAAGLRALPSGMPPEVDINARAEELRRRLAVAAAVSERTEELAAAATRDRALRREMAGTGLGAVPGSDLETVVPLIRTVRSGRIIRRALLGVAGVACLAGASGAAAAWAAGRAPLAAAVGIGLAAALTAIAVLGWFTSRAPIRARRALASLLPGADLEGDGLNRLVEALPAATRIHREREQRAGALDAGRAELDQARAELEVVVDGCCALAAECGARAAARPPRGSSVLALAAGATRALDGVDDLARQAARRGELEVEDSRLGAEEHQLADLGAEAGRRREVAASVEGRIRSITGAAGIDGSLPPLAAVAAFRDACERRREHDRLASRLAEVRRHHDPGSHPEAAAQRREDLISELRRRSGDPGLVTAGPPPDADQLAELERAAVSAQNRAGAALSASEVLRARLEGMTGGLPSLADLEDDRLAVAAARDRALHQQAALQRAIEMIEAASREVHGRLAPRLAESVSTRVSRLTSERYTQVNVDTEHFAVALAGPDRDQLVALELLSHGTRDQVALLLRLALCELLGGSGESLPLLLDEPLASSDPSRRLALSKFLSHLATTNQLVLTTSDPQLAAALSAEDGSGGAAVLDLESGVSMADASLAAPEP